MDVTAPPEAVGDAGSGPGSTPCRGGRFGPAGRASGKVVSGEKTSLRNGHSGGRERVARPARRSIAEGCAEGAHSAARVAGELALRFDANTGSKLPGYTGL